MLGPWNGGTTYYEYGPMGRMESIHTAQGGWAYYDYDPAGHCTRRQNPNGTLAYFSYDEAGRISGLRNLKGDMSPICYFDYAYDEAGLVTSIACEGGVAIYYGYDAASRLTGETWHGPAGMLYAFAYGYDPAGNRAWKDIGGTLTYYTYDAAERLLHEVADAKYTYYSYDKNGSCTRIEEPDEGKYTYFVYNDARLLRSAHVLPEDRWNYFHYDGNLTRYCIEDSLGCQYYYWDGLKLLERDNLTTGAARAFTHGHAPVPGIANMVEYAEGEDCHDFHYDMRGTVHGITDAEQDVAQTYEHDAWGVKLSEAGDLENPIQYQGCAWLKATDSVGLFHSPTRQFFAGSGRLAQRDSGLGVAPFDAYSYVGNAPSGEVDPHGRRREAPPPGQQPPKQDPPSVAILRGMAQEVDERYESGQMELAAEPARRMFRYIAFGAKWYEPWAAKFMQNWLDGAPKSTYELPSDLVKDLIHQEAVLSYLSEATTKWVPNIQDCVGELREEHKVHPAVYTEGGKSDFYHAIGGFDLIFTGTYCCSKGQCEFKGTWRVEDDYSFKPGLGTWVPRKDVVWIKDDWALLVETYYGAKPFKIRGVWQGTVKVKFPEEKPKGENHADQ